ncbi:MAG: DNA-binding protein YbaB [Flavobacteriales bacterium]|jgi:DNA-binding protein YbaB
MTAIKLLEKLGADASFDPSLLSVEDKKTLEDIILKAKTFNAIEVIHAPDEEEEDESEKEDNDSEKDKEK